MNGWFLVGPGNIASLGQSSYGLLLIAKLVLFGGMLGLAALNRYRLTPALAQAIEEEDAPRAQALLRASLFVEGGLAIVILGPVASAGDTIAAHVDVAYRFGRLALGEANAILHPAARDRIDERL